MTVCGEWRERLEDHALGLPADAPLAQHLATCAVCAAALVEWRAHAGQIDAGVRRLIAAEPSTDFSSRVLAEIRQPQSPWAWNPRWSVAFAALALAAVIGVLAFALRRGRERRDQADQASSAAAVLSRWRSPTEPLLRSLADTVLKSVPRLGESYFEIEPQTGTSRDEKGGKNAT